MLFFHSGGPAPGGQPVAFRPWTFVSNAFFGEDAAGTWRLSLRDTYANNSAGTINGAVLLVFGDVAGPDDRYVFTDEFGAVAGMPTASVLADAGGEDTIDASAASTASVIDLRAGTAGQVAGAPLLVAPGILIEHAIGGDGHDRLIGNGAANHLRGGRGNDVLLGLGGDDMLEGGAGRDSLDGGAERDVLRGGAGIDVFMFGPDDLFSAAPDLILDFRLAAAPGAERDGISLRAIDAFAFIGAAPLTAPGQLRVWFDGVDTVIEGNTVGGVEPELRIRLVGGGLVAAEDFSL